jgi:hypothetical protein
MFTNPEASRLLTALGDLETQANELKSQLHAIQAVCSHQFPTRGGIWGDHCTACGKYFKQVDRIGYENRRRGEEPNESM